MGGGQFKNAVKQIIEAERQPIKQVEARKAREETKNKLFQDFKGKFNAMDRSLLEFNNFKKFRELKADLGTAGEYIGLTIDKDRAEPGSYNLQIDSLAKRSSAISNGFKDPNEPSLGIGYLVFETPDGESKEIFVDHENSSLRNVAALINKESGAPVQASVMKDSSGSEPVYRLIMSAKKDGRSEGIDFPELYFLDGEHDIWFDGKNDAQNAVVKVDDFELELESNNIKDFLPGVNLNLKQAAPDRPFQINITQDYQKITGKVKGMVDQINGVLDFINKQNQVDDKSDTKGTFAGDSGLQTVEFRLRNIMHEAFPVGNWEDTPDQFLRLADLGIEFQKSGSLSLKEDKFQKVLETRFDDVAEAISGEFGFANRLSEVITPYTTPGVGVLAMKEQSMRNRIKQYDQEIASKEARLAQREERLVGQFSRLQGSLNDLQRQQSALGALGGGGGGGNMLQQLLGS